MIYSSFYKQRKIWLQEVNDILKLLFFVFRFPRLFIRFVIDRH